MAVDRETAEEFAALGVHIEVDETDEDDADACHVWDVNRDSVWLFLDLETQWRAAMGLRGLVWLGLDYVAADVVIGARRRLRRKRHRLLEDLRVMEREALDTLDSMRETD